MMLPSFILLLVLFGLAAKGSEASIGIITGDGVCRPVSQLEKQLKGLSEDTAPVIGVLDCSSTPTSRNMCNGLFDVDFNGEGTGVTVHSSQSANIIRASFNTMNGKEFNGAKAVDFFTNLDCALIIIGAEKGVTSFVHAQDQIFRRFLSNLQGIPDNSTVKKSLILVLEGPAASGEESQEEFTSVLEAIWQELDGANSAPLSSVLDFNAIALPPGADVTTSEARTAVDALISSSEQRISAERISSAWGKIPQEVRPILSKVQQESMYVISSSFLTCQKNADASLIQMQKRISNNKVLASFGKRVQELLETILRDFHAKVQGTVLIVERAERANQLKTNILTTAVDMFSRQVGVQEQNSLQRFRRELGKLYGKVESPSASEVDQLLRKAIFEHKAALSSLENESLGFVVDDLQEFTKKLETEAVEFPSSLAYKLITLRRAEQQIKDAPKKKKRRKEGFLSFLKVSTTIVGMLRPPGYGGFQGYVNYRSSILGRPLDFLLGVQNDGESPEIIGDDREHPLLRLQPKFHFDIDI